MRNTVTEELLKHYFSVTQRAFDEIKLVLPENTHLKKIADDFLDMAKRYFSDAHYFYEKGDFINAFGAVYYAHAWLDAGARLGLWDVNHDNTLFTVD